jgi:SAM-dependent methyltransferase
MSNGERFSPGLPPIVPLIPEMLLINDTCSLLPAKIRFPLYLPITIHTAMAPQANDDPPEHKPIAPDWFREWFDSPYYYRLYADRDEKEAAGFIGRVLGLLQPPPASEMLDVACGRGRYSYILARQGFEVTGIDLAPSAIAYAQQFGNDRLHFYLHDMRQMLCTNCFDYAFNFFTSFGYFHTRREHSNAIRSVSLALRGRGHFLLDYMNYPYAEKHLVPHAQKTIEHTVYTLTKWYDATHFYKKIEISDESLTAPLEFCEKVAKFSLGDFESLFTPHGLTIRQVFGNYQLDPYDRENSPRMVILAEKRV